MNVKFPYSLYENLKLAVYQKCIEYWIDKEKKVASGIHYFVSQIIFIFI